MVTNSKGFTLLELMIIITIVGISMAMAAPGLRSMIANNQISSSASDFASALQLAKAEAVARVNSVVICKKNSDSTGCIASGDWSQGWIVFSDDNGDGSVAADSSETVLLVHEALHERITFGGEDGVNELITFRPAGTSSVDGTKVLTICDERGLEYSSRAIRVTITGRGSVMKATDIAGLTACI